MDCLEKYIGIRGECTKAKLYLDDLPGINIVKVAEMTDEVDIRPLDMVRKNFRQAKKEVLQDIISMLNIGYNQNIDDAQYNYAGSSEWYGLVNEDWIIKINKLEKDKFIKLHVFNFALVVDRDVIGAEFTVTDDYGFEEIISQDLTQGINYIEIDHNTKSQWLKLKFNLSNFKVGIKEDAYSYCQSGKCHACERTNSCGCACLSVELYKDDVLSSDLIGYNLTAQCVADECELLRYLTPSLDMPLIYKTGIHYLLEIKNTQRVNAYVRNSEDEIDAMLTLWMGGYDNVNDVKIYSMYWKKVKQAANNIKSMIYKLNTNIFSNTGNVEVCNTLPG